MNHNMVDLVLIKQILDGYIQELDLFKLSLIISFFIYHSFFTFLYYLPLIYPLVVELMSYQDVFFWSSLLYAIFLLFYPLISLFNQSPEAVIFLFLYLFISYNGLLFLLLQCVVYYLESLASLLSMFL